VVDGTVEVISEGNWKLFTHKAPGLARLVTRRGYAARTPA
jgi:hypothetical protein